MKMKFENQDLINKIREDIIEINKPKITNTKRTESEKITNSTNIAEINSSHQHILNRQLSDPNKCNIKRTPAFRLDKNTFIEKEHMFQRHLSQNNIKTKMDKFKSLDDSSRLKENCDNINMTKKTSDKINDIKNQLYSIRDDLNTRNDKSVLIKDLYAEPVPKSVRLLQKTNVENDVKIETAEKVITILKDLDQHSNGTDTIKNALKRPLPPGPAPKKPPRTFQHSRKVNCSLIEKQLKSPEKVKKDPKYMLDKLENALRNNKIKLHRQARFDYNSDEDEKFRSPSKSLTNSPLLKRLNNTTGSLGSNQIFNCLPSLGCSRNRYARIKEPNSSFFVTSRDEPIYAEPFQFNSEEREYDIPCIEDTDGIGMKRNSLYYMSNPVLGLKSDATNATQTTTVASEDMDKIIVKEMINQCETSSLSTFSSDTDSNVSSPGYTKESTLVLVKDLIKSFEGKSSSHEPETVNKPNGVPLRNQQPSSDNDHKRYGLVVRDGIRTSERKKKDTKKFEIYVKTVRAFSIRKMNNDNLFHCCLLVGLDEKSPYIKSKFPSNVQIPAYIEKLCFPDSDDHRVSYSAREQCYSLVITDASGERIYGYCRRVLPEGSCCCLPLAYCILTKHRAPRFYKKILLELESHHGLPDKQRDALINEFYKQKFPKPGQSIKLDFSKIIHREVKYYGSETISQNNNEPNRKSDDLSSEFCLVQSACPHGFIKDSCNSDSSQVCESCRAEESSELILTLHQDVRYEETDLKELCDTLDSSILLKVFENLLLERKGIVVDLDTKEILLEVDEEEKILPCSAIKYWRKGLSIANSIKTTDNEHNVLLSDAFIRVFIMTCGHYKDYISNGVFDKQGFKNFPNSKGVKRFLQWFTLTSMFDLFIEAVLANPDSFYIFDSRIRIYSSQDATLILQKMKDWTNNLRP
ncbi:suppression of tumorigenicity 5 st5 [Holotrichia oblita]|uniref:Suppression of tumorigenicity 5 st5 n=1 Tax=Holotrichia oblita TaxID=644536 RepID=A0ACB9T678_HOLOL|nr:suppression of tumorigenicity 5 st5 [Holotrichia oblita]